MSSITKMGEIESTWSPMCGFGNWWQSLWTNVCIELYLKDLSICNACRPYVGFMVKRRIKQRRCKVDQDKWYSRKIQRMVLWELSLKWPEYPACTRRSLRWRMSWRIRRLSESSCLSSRHHHYEVRRKDSSLIKAKCKFKMDISKRLYAWSLPHILDGNGYVKMCLNESLPYWVWVSSLWFFIKQEQEYAIKKGAPTWEGEDRHHLAQVGCARQRYYLDRFSLLPVSWC